MKPRTVILLFLLAVGVFYVLTLRTGLPPGDDFAQYIAHARNIVDGTSYSRTGYIYNPHNARIGPPEYPPLFPLMLAGIYKATGMNFTAMKILDVILWLAALYVFYLAFARELPYRYMAATLAILALNPYFWSWKDEIISDIPFLLLCYAALWISTFNNDRWRERPWLRLAATAACVYLSFATRTAAIILIPTLVVADLVQSRRPALATGAAVVAVGLMIAHVTVFHGSLAYADQLNAPAEHHTQTHPQKAIKPAPKAPVSAAEGVRAYRDAFVRCLRGFMWQMESSLWNNASSVLLTKLFCITALLLGAIGYALRLRRGPGVFDIFAAGYAAMILVWNAPDLRLLFPLIPLWVLCAATALEALWRWNGGRVLAKMVMAAVFAQVVFAYGSAYAHAEYGEIRTGIRNPNFRAVCDYIRQDTPRNAVLIYAQPRMLALLTERSSSAYHQPSDDTELWEYFREISATHIIATSWIPADQSYLAGFIARGGTRLHEVFRNPEYVVYEILPAAKTSVERPYTAAWALARSATAAFSSNTFRVMSSATSRTMVSIGVDGR